MLVLEHAPGGSMEGLIESGMTARWTESQTLQVACQLARGVGPVPPLRGDGVAALGGLGLALGPPLCRLCTRAF